MLVVGGWRSNAEVFIKLRRIYMGFLCGVFCVGDRRARAKEKEGS